MESKKDLLLPTHNADVLLLVIKHYYFKIFEKQKKTKIQIGKTFIELLGMKRDRGFFFFDVDRPSRGVSYLAGD